MIHLTRTDPTRNMARFYTMRLQPTLFGDWALLREWGRIGRAGRLVSVRFASEQDAARAMTDHLKAKLCKGYEANRDLADKMGVSNATISRKRAPTKVIGEATLERVIGTDLDKPGELDALAKMPEAAREMIRWSAMQ